MGAVVLVALAVLGGLAAVRFFASVLSQSYEDRRIAAAFFMERPEVERWKSARARLVRRLGRPLDSQENMALAALASASGNVHCLESVVLGRISFQTAAFIMNARQSP